MTLTFDLEDRPYLLLALGVIVAGAIVSALVYPDLPAEVATHWNAAGEPDDFMDKSSAVLLFPGITLAVVALGLVAPRIDPLRENVLEFRDDLDTFIAVTAVFLTYLHVLVMMINLGAGINILTGMAPGIGFLYYAAGVFFSRAQRNWFFGIRTPWTMSSERVWRDTHLIGARLMKFAGVMAVIGVMFPRYTLLFVTVPVATVSLVAVAYSYMSYHHLQ